MTTATLKAEEKVVRKGFIGTVKSSGMNKSIVVDIVTSKPERIYKKYIKHTKRVMAHDERNEASPGDKVSIVECRPISKRKCWRLVEVIERATRRSSEATA